MKILVALKQVPDTEMPTFLAADGRGLEPDLTRWILNPYDEYALEEAIRLKETLGAQVTAVSVGSDEDRPTLRKALALGADAAVLIRSGETGDPLALARALAGYARDKGFDLLLFGSKGLGTDHGATGAMCAELLGLALASQVTRLELGAGTFRAEREGEGGSEVVEGQLPAVITAQRGLNEPRYASLKGTIAARRMPVEQVQAGTAAAATRVVRMALAPTRSGGRKLEGDAATQAAVLVRLLKTEAKVL
jgi:electron transfer flavoprotein beta subunit